MENNNDLSEQVQAEYTAQHTEYVHTLSPVASQHPNKLEQYKSLFLPLAILIGAVLVSGTILYTKNSSTTVVKPKPPKPAIVTVAVAPNDHILGSPSAKITIIEFADFRCPFCERFFTQTESQLIKQYVDTGKVRFVFKNYAFLNQQSVWTSEAAECAGEQGKFWEYHNWLYNNQAEETDPTYYSKANLVKYANKVGGIKIPQFAQCLNTDKYAKLVSDELALGKSAGIDGTPSFLIAKGDNFQFDGAFVRYSGELNQFVIPLANKNYAMIGAQSFDTVKTILDKMLK